MDDKQYDISPPTSKEAHEMWENIISNIRIREKEKKRNKIIRYSTAASVAILLMIGGIFSYNTFIRPDIYFAESQNSEIKLADGSIVILSQGAKLTVEKSFPSDTREVLLEGDATFKVAKSKQHPFVVHGQGYETKVLGTIFKVSQSGNTFKVDLFEGKVLVYKSGHPKDPVPLSPKQTFTNYGISGATSVSETQGKNTTVSKDKSASLTFNECPMTDAVKVIEKTYRIKLNYPKELENAEVTLTSVNVSATSFIQKLAIQLNLNIKRNNDSIFELEK